MTGAAECGIPRSAPVQPGATRGSIMPASTATAFETAAAPVRGPSLLGASLGFVSSTLGLIGVMILFGSF